MVQANRGLNFEWFVPLENRTFEQKKNKKIKILLNFKKFGF